MDTLREQTSLSHAAHAPTLPLLSLITPKLLARSRPALWYAGVGVCASVCPTATQVSAGALEGVQAPVPPPLRYAQGGIKHLQPWAHLFRHRQLLFPFLLACLLAACAPCVCATAARGRKAAPETRLHT